MLDLKKNYKNKNESEKLLKKEKKHPKANLENYSKIFAQLGLVLALLVVYVLIQNKSFEKEVTAMMHTPDVLFDDTPEIIEIQIEEKPISKKKVVLDVVKEVDNNTEEEESVVDVIDVDAPVEEPVFKDVDIIDETIIEDVPFTFLEEVPVFPGCKGTNEEIKACFTKKISLFVNRKFDAGIAEEMGLSSGVQKIFAIFKVDNVGNIVDIQARSPHKQLKNEAIRVIKLLPKMEPGKQHGKAVNVKYSLPISFRIQ